MLNKLKRGVKYIIKKIKRGIEVVAKNINDMKCAVAKTVEVGANVASEMYKAKCEVEIKKLELIKSVGSTIHKDIKAVGSIISRNKIPTAIIFLGVAGGLISAELLSKEV